MNDNLPAWVHEVNGVWVFLADGQEASYHIDAEGVGHCHIEPKRD